MKSILHVLYRGKLCPGEMNGGRNTEICRMEHRFEENQQKFMEQLDEERGANDKQKQNGTNQKVQHLGARDKALLDTSFLPCTHILGRIGGDGGGDGDKASGGKAIDL